MGRRQRSVRRELWRNSQGKPAQESRHPQARNDETQNRDAQEIDDEGVTRKTPFGSAMHPWKTLGPYRVDRGKRSAWITRQGRGTARFLPPVLLLWEERGSIEFRPRLEQALETHLGHRLGA